MDLITDGVIVWVEADLPNLDADVVALRVFTPPDLLTGERTLWQRCRYSYTGPGSYRCGMTLEGLAVGRWLGRVTVDGVRVAEYTFLI